jgi:glycosyltransferase involved in cell wall biosynthesis
VNKNKSPLITIGIPTHNRADSFLNEALGSAIAQNYENIEIIVSDNFSTDNTEAIVKKYSDPRIIYIRHDKNIGAINNFNYCVNMAKGSYLLLLHDDDKIDEDFISVCIEAIPKGFEPGVFFTGTRVIDEDSKVVHETTNCVGGFSTKEFLLGWFENKIPLYLCSTLYNTKRLQELGGFQSKTNHFLDVVASVKLAAKYGRVDIYDIKASFRRHSSNSGGNVKRITAWCEDSIYLLDVMCELLPEDCEELRHRGMPWLCKKNYRLASSIKNPFKRIIVYFMIYKYFDYCCSPIMFLKSTKFFTA